MRRRIIAFYDVLLYGIICSPLIVTTVKLLFLLITKGTSEWIYENWHLVILFAITFMIPIGGMMLIRYCIINNNSVRFHYFPFTKSREKAFNNIDFKWNQNVFISEIKDIEVVKLTEEEQQTKVYYKHWFNKYLKINLNNGNYKYVYVGNYSHKQTTKIIKTLTKG